MFSLNKIKQLNLFDQVSELNYLSTKQPVGFLNLLSDHFDLESFIPESFSKHYYSTLGRDRDYKLSSILSALILMQIFHIPTNVLFHLFLIFSTEIREFCGFYDSVPDESYFSRFKTDFEKDIADLFNSLVPNVIDICNEFNLSLPDNSPYKDRNSMLIYDTSGLKPKVKENNPKTLVSEINKQKSYAKATNKKDYNAYAAAYKNMPKFSEANPNIKLDFVNGHFGYFYKFGILTNGLGIPLGINFFDENFYSSVKQEFETPEEQKYAYDNASLKSVVKPFINNIKSKSSFQFKSEGSCGGKNRSVRYKFTCPKSYRDKKGKCYHTCETPCTDKKSGRMTYVYPDKDFRLYPGIQRNSDEWAKTYKIRTIIEREISCFKFNPCIQSPNTVNTTTMRSDLYLTDISKLINVILAHSLNNPRYIRSIRKLLVIAV